MLVFLNVYFFSSLANATTIGASIRVTISTTVDLLVRFAFGSGNRRSLSSPTRVDLVCGGVEQKDHVWRPSMYGIFTYIYMMFLLNVGKLCRTWMVGGLVQILYLPGFDSQTELWISIRKIKCLMTPYKNISKTGTIVFKKKKQINQSMPKPVYNLQLIMNDELESMMIWCLSLGINF